MNLGEGYTLSVWRNVAGDWSWYATDLSGTRRGDAPTKAAAWDAARAALEEMPTLRPPRSVTTSYGLRTVRNRKGAP